jgi:hypothetical protein
VPPLRKQNKPLLSLSLLGIDHITETEWFFEKIEWLLRKLNVFFNIFYFTEFYRTCYFKFFNSVLTKIMKWTLVVFRIF